MDTQNNLQGSVYPNVEFLCVKVSFDVKCIIFFNVVLSINMIFFSKQGFSLA